MTDIAEKSVRLPSAGALQGVVLCVFSLVSVAAAVLLTPVVPSMIAHFAPLDPAAQSKTIVALTAPALVFGLSSPFVGHVVDTIGRRRVLNISLLFYGVFGVAPFFLDDLDLIIVSRLLVGLMEGAIMTAATTLIGDYFERRDREKWLVMQTIYTSLSSVAFIAAGGALGEYGWHAPFLIYGLAFLAIPVSLVVLHEPSRHMREIESSSSFPWRTLMPLYLLALLISILFFVPLIQLPFILNSVGIHSTQVIGITSAVGCIAVPGGALIFNARASRPFSENQAIAFALIAVGFALMVVTFDYWIIVAGLVIASLGTGLIFPTITTAIMNHLSFELRGRGMGGWGMAFSLGNFLSPVIVMALTGMLGQLASSILVLAGVAAICMTVAGIVRLAG